MKVINIHQRVIHQPKAKIAALMDTLATSNDQMLAIDKWPRMKLKDGKTVGSKGGHGPIRYTVSDYKAGEYIQFEFSRPLGFHGHHAFQIQELGADKTELKHIIDMNTKGTGTLKWLFAVRWLHDALIEDAFDRVANHFSPVATTTDWNWWVIFLRKQMAKRSHK